MRLTGGITWWKLKRSTTDCKFSYGPEEFTAANLAKLTIYPADGEISSSLITLTWGEGLPDQACHHA